MSFTVNNKKRIEVKQDLKPCPFCGNKDVFVHSKDDYNFYVSCSCGATVQGKESQIFVGFDKAIQSAIDGWNNRSKL